MEAFITLLTVIMVGLLAAAALAFGVALALFVAATAAVTVALVLLREKWRRWRFVRRARSQEIIEGEFTEITVRQRKEEP